MSNNPTNYVDRFGLQEAPVDPSEPEPNGDADPTSDGKLGDSRDESEAQAFGRMVLGDYKAKVVPNPSDLKAADESGTYCPLRDADGFIEPYGPVKLSRDSIN